MKLAIPAFTLQPLGITALISHLSEDSTLSWLGWLTRSHYILRLLLHTHTHPFNSRLSRTTRVSQYQKVKPVWILLKQETVSGSGVRCAICKSAPRSRQITMLVPHHSVFYRPDALPATQPTASKHWRQKYTSSTTATAATTTTNNNNKKLSYRWVTAWCVLSVVILPVTTQQCRKYLYDKSWPNRWYEVGGLVGGNVRFINKLTTVELCISPVYRRLAVAKFSKSTM